MRITRHLYLYFFLLLQVTAIAQPGIWSKDKANSWYDQQTWLVGANFLPSTAINELEMWQAETFDTATISKELRWASSIGMNTMRVFLHDLAYKQDPAGFKNVSTFF